MLGPLAVVLLATPAAPIVAAELAVEVRAADGSALADAVVYAVPHRGRVPPPTREAVMDQYNRTFIPHVLTVQTGTPVRFPNSDDIRHQVYSFSPAKRFQIPLYEGTPADPVVFDTAGVLTLGCNIHDRMRAYIVVVDTPYFATAEQGRAELSGLPAGTYDLRVWYPGMREEPPPQTITMNGSERREMPLMIARR